MRHRGSNSGLSTCRLASSRTVAAAPTNATDAAPSSGAVIGFAISLSSVYLMTFLLFAGTSAVPLVRDVGASGHVRTSRLPADPQHRAGGGGRGAPARWRSGGAGVG